MAVARLDSSALVWYPRVDPTDYQGGINLRQPTATIPPPFGKLQSIVVLKTITVCCQQTMVEKGDEIIGKVAMGLSMSLDGFIAGPNDGPESPLGEGGERLFAWYSSGETAYNLPGTEMVFNVSPQSAELLREAHTKMGRS
jgi:hypothetical protein